MIQRKIITYSLLAHINNTKEHVSQLSELFEPIIMRSLAIYFSGDKTAGLVSDIYKIILEEYALDMPIPFIKAKIIKLSKVKPNKYGLRITDDAIFATKYKYNDYIDVIEKKNKQLMYVEQDFMTYATEKNCKFVKLISLYDFIDANREQLINLLLGKPVEEIGEEYVIHAQYIQSVLNDEDKIIAIKEAYLGSIISCYLEEDSNDSADNVELVLDTNFIISLLSLHSDESNDICRKVYNIGSKMGYTFSVLDKTFEETTNLLRDVSEEIREFKTSTTTAFSLYEREITQQAIYRGTTTTDLQSKANNLKDILKREFGIDKLTSTKHLQLKAENDPRYKKYCEEKKHKSKTVALHDTIAMLYVENRRGGNIERFEDVNCWFLQDFNNVNYRMYKSDGTLYEKINSHMLLNMLWLHCPSADSKALGLINSSLTRLLTLTLNRVKPTTSMLKQFEDIVIKYKDNFNENDLLMLKKLLAGDSIDNLAQIIDIENEEKTAVELIRVNINKQEQKEAAYQASTDEKIGRLTHNVEENNRKLDQANKKIQKQDIKIVGMKRSTDTLQSELNKKSSELDDSKKLVSLQKEYLEVKDEFESYTDQFNEVKSKCRKVVYGNRVIAGLIVIITVGLAIYLDSTDYFNGNSPNYTLYIFGFDLIVGIFFRKKLESYLSLDFVLKNTNSKIFSDAADYYKYNKFTYEGLEKNLKRIKKEIEMFEKRTA